MHAQQEEDEATAKELADQIKREEEEAAKAEEKKKAEFSDNNFWKPPDSGYDIDDLMKDMAD